MGIKHRLFGHRWQHRLTVNTAIPGHNLVYESCEECPMWRLTQHGAGGMFAAGKEFLWHEQSKEFQDEINQRMRGENPNIPFR